MYIFFSLTLLINYTLKNYTRMWANAHVIAALPIIGGALCSAPQSLAGARCSNAVQ